MRRLFVITLMILLVSSLILGACARPAPAPSPSPVPSPVPTVKPAPAPSPAPSPSPTPSPAPSPTAKPSPSPTVSPTATAAPTPIKLIFATGWPPPPNVNAVLGTKWGELLNQRTNGRVEVRTIFGGALLAAKDTLDGVSKGTADVAGWYPGWDPGKVPIRHSLVTLVDLEYGAQLDALGQALVANQLFKDFPQFEQELEKIGAKTMHMAPTASYTMVFKKPVKSLGDLNGRKFRCLPGFEPLYKAIGMIPVTMDPADVYTSISSGLVDGAMASIDYFPNSKWYEVAPYHVIPAVKGFGPWSALPATYHIMSLKTWNSLPPDVQKIILDINNEITAMAVKLSQDGANKAAADLERLTGNKNYYLTQAEFDKWVATAPDAWSPVAKKMTDAGAPGSDIISRYKAIVKDYQSGKLKPWW